MSTGQQKSTFWRSFFCVAKLQGKKELFMFFENKNWRFKKQKRRNINCSASFVLPVRAITKLTYSDLTNLIGALTKPSASICAK